MRRGFTILEILIVISIIVILSVIGIGSYRSSRLTIMINLEADKMVATLHALREEARNAPVCSEVLFEKNTAPKKRNGVFQGKNQQCDFTGKPYTTLGTSPEIVSTSSLSVTFIPPHGKMVLTPSHEEVAVMLILKTNEQVSRVINLNTKTGKIEAS